MEKYHKELTPVQYSSAGVKIHHYQRYKKGVRLHWHDRMELIRLHKGEMQVGYGENTAKLSPGEIYIVPPKTPHAVEKLPGLVEYDVVMFDVRWFYNETQLCQDLLPGIFDGRARFAITTGAQETVECFDRICQTYEEDSLETIALIYRLIHLLLKHSLLEFAKEVKGDRTIREAVEYIKENFAQEISTETLARSFGYSSAHFCRKFKEATWLTPMNYLKIHRLEEAARLIKQGCGSISDIAARCGFSDSNYFTRCFTAHFGVPPTKYEKN